MKVIKLILLLSAFSFLNNCNQKENKKLVFIEEDTIAIVNNQRITLTKFEKNIQNFLFKIPLLNKQYKSNKDKIHRFILDKLIIEELISQEANKKNIIVNDDVVNQLTNNIITDNVLNNISQLLSEQNTNIDEWQQSFKFNLIVNRIIDQEVIEKIRITKKEVFDHYQKNKKQYTIQKQYEVLHILIKTKETAKNVLQLLKNGADFENLVSIYSIAADKTTSGNMGFVRRNELPAIINKAIVRLRKAGDLSKIIKTNFGFHIFKLKSIKPKKNLKLSEVRKQIVKNIKIMRSQKAIQDWIENLKSNATIMIHKNVLENYVNI